MEMSIDWVRDLYKKRAAVYKTLAVLFVMAAPEFVLAATTGEAFKAAYEFMYEAATGYLGRAIAIIGGIIGLGTAAATGKALPAIIGVILALFGALGPTIINAIFGTGALI